MTTGTDVVGFDEACTGVGDGTTPLSLTRFRSLLSCAGVRPWESFSLLDSRFCVLGVRTLVRMDGEAEPGVFIESFGVSATRLGLPSVAADLGLGGVPTLATSAGVVNTYPVHILIMRVLCKLW